MLKDCKILFEIKKLKIKGIESILYLKTKSPKIAEINKVKSPDLIV